MTSKYGEKDKVPSFKVCFQSVETKVHVQEYLTTKALAKHCENVGEPSEIALRFVTQMTRRSTILDCVKKVVIGELLQEKAGR